MEKSVALVVFSHMWFILIKVTSYTEPFSARVFKLLKYFMNNKPGNIRNIHLIHSRPFFDPHLSKKLSNISIYSNSFVKETHVNKFTIILKKLQFVVHFFMGHIMYLSSGLFSLRKNLTIVNTKCVPSCYPLEYCSLYICCSLILEKSESYIGYRSVRAPVAFLISFCLVILLTNIYCRPG